MGMPHMYGKSCAMERKDKLRGRRQCGGRIGVFVCFIWARSMRYVIFFLSFILLAGSFSALFLIHPSLSIATTSSAMIWYFGSIVRENKS